MKRFTVTAMTVALLMVPQVGVACLDLDKRNPLVKTFSHGFGSGIEKDLGPFVNKNPVEHQGEMSAPGTVCQAIRFRENSDGDPSASRQISPKYSDGTKCERSISIHGALG